MKQLLLLIFLLMGALNVSAQTDTSQVVEKTLYLVVKTDGNQFYGYVLQDDGREILLETKTIGKIFINKSEISKIEKVQNEAYIESGDTEYKDYREEGAFTTRYYFTTNALPIKKNDNYAMIHLYGPEVHFAVSDNFSVGVMASWIASPIALAMKYSFNSEGKTHVAIGTIMGSSGYLLNARGYGGLHWLTVTHGDRKANFSFSAGYAYVGGLDGLFGSRNQFYGQGVQVQSYNPSEAYYVDSYDGENAVRSRHSDIFVNSTRGSLSGAGVIGVSGIVPVGKKASFIFDSMTFISEDKRQKYSVAYESTTESFTYNKYDPNTGNTNKVIEDLTFGKGKLVENPSTVLKATIIMMPAMRFNTSYNSSFQVALAGVINLRSNGEGTSFPAPMVSWLKKF